MGLASGSDIPPMDPYYPASDMPASDLPASDMPASDMSSGSEGPDSDVPYTSGAYGYMPPGPGNMDGDMYPDYMDSHPYVPDAPASYPSGPYSAPYYPGYPAAYPGYHDPMPAYPNDPVDGGAAPITAPVMPGSDGD